MNTVSRKRVLIVIAVLLLLFIVAGVCLFFFTFQEKKEHKQDTVTPSMVTAKIIREMNYQDVTSLQEDQLTKYYNIPEGVLADFSVCMSKSANSGFELSCFELADDNKFDALQKSIADHVASRSQGFKGANPVEYQNILDSTVERKGRFVLLVICDDPQPAIKIFRSFV